MRSFPMRLAVLLVFLVSGAAGLVYQVAWTRQLTLMLGVTSEAISTVLAVFMGGLALGAWLLGRLADRVRSPLRLYAVLEAGIALAGAASPLLLDALTGVYVDLRRSGVAGPGALAALRIVLAAAALLVPTTLMGGTLPILVRGLNRVPGQLSRDAGTLYAINTLGAVVGTLATAFVLIQAVGVRHTIWLAASLNALVGLAAFVLARAEREDTAPRRAPVTRAAAPDPAPDRRTVRAVLVAYAISGFLALAYEVLWTRWLIAVAGENSVYAFSLMLAAFLLGIVLGSAVAAIIGDRVRDLVLFLGVVMVGVGVSALFTMGLMEVAVGMLALPPDASFLELSLRRFLRCIAVLIVPTTFSGMTFAIVAKLYARDPQRVGHDAGVAYAANTIGAILGALAGGFAILPLLGLQRGLLLLSAVSVATGLFLVLRRRPDGTRPWRVAGVALVFALSGAYSVASGRDLFQRTMESPDYDVLFYEPGKQSTVAVMRWKISGELGLIVDNDSQAGTHAHLQVSLRLLGHLPLLFHPAPKDVLVVAFGAGMTTGSALQHPIERLDQIELSSSVIRAAPLFAPFNHDPLADPRLRLIQDDGRNYLLSTDQTYDVITSDPIDPDDAGVTSLYSKEYYELIRDRLRPGGVAAQWIPSRYDAESYWLLVRTFQAVFPVTSVWHSGITTVVVGSKEEPAVDAASIARRMADPRVRASLAVVGIEDPDSLLSLYTAGPDETRRLAGPGPLNTDDHPRIEYAGPRSTGSDLKGISSRVGVDLIRLRQPDLRGWVAGWSDADSAALAPFYGLMTRTLERNALFGPVIEAAELYGVAAPVSEAELTRASREWLDRTWDALLAEAPRILRIQVGLKEQEPSSSDGDGSFSIYTEELRSGRSAWAAGDFAAAETHFQRAAAAEPDLLRPKLLAAGARERAGDLPGAVAALLAVQARDPEVGSQVLRLAGALVDQWIAALRRGDPAAPGRARAMRGLAPVGIATEDGKVRPAPPAGALLADADAWSAWWRASRGSLRARAGRYIW
jgi:spermidine synthase